MFSQRLELEDKGLLFASCNLALKYQKLDVSTYICPGTVDAAAYGPYAAGLAGVAYQAAPVQPAFRGQEISLACVTMACF